MRTKSTKAISKVKPKPGWDLYRDGISFSLLSKFVDCRERFRIATVELKTPNHKKDSLDFGTMFHKALELYAAGKNSFQIVKALNAAYKDTSVSPILVRTVVVMVPLYIDFYKKVKLKYVGQEEVFDIPYVSKTNGKIIRLRGRWDELFTEKGKLWLQENKTKKTIQEDIILQTLPFDLQTMLYCYTLQIAKKKPIGGVLYNVVRKPILIQGARETDAKYLERIKLDVQNRPEHYFKRFRNPFMGDEIAQFERHWLAPLVEQVVIWWESIKKNPFDPWTLENGNLNPHHYVRPFGVFSPLSFGIGDFFEYITTGDDAGLLNKDSCFPELEGEQGCIKKEKPKVKTRTSSIPKEQQSKSRKVKRKPVSV